MTMDEKFKQVEDWQRKIDSEFYEGLESADQFEPYDWNEEIRLKTIRLQFGIRNPAFAGCMTVRTSGGESVDDYDLCAYFD